VHDGGVSTSEPFLPIKNAHADAIDAADPGLGAPGTIIPPEQDEAELSAAEQAFEERMDQEREREPLFRPPVPKQHD